MARTHVSTCLCMQVNCCKHVRTSLIGYRSGGTPCVFTSRGALLELRAVDEGAVPASAPATSRLFVLPVAARRWVLTDNTFWHAQWDSSSTTTPAAEMTGAQDQASVLPVTKPVTYEELTLEHKQKYDEAKAQFEADLIGSFERTRNHVIRWKGFSPEGALDNIDLSVPSEERTRALRQEMNYMVAHTLHRH